MCFVLLLDDLDPTPWDESCSSLPRERPGSTHPLPNPRQREHPRSSNNKYGERNYLCLQRWNILDGLVYRVKLSALYWLLYCFGCAAFAHNYGQTKPLSAGSWRQFLLNLGGKCWIFGHKSDHCIIIAEVLATKSARKVTERAPNWTKADLHGIKTYLAGINWDDLFHNKSAEEAWDILKDKISNRKVCPKINIEIKYRNKMAKQRDN